MVTTAVSKLFKSYKKMEKLAKKSIDMTEGPLFGKILLFVLPMMATNLLQVAYNAADMMIVSLSNEANAVGAIGTTGAFINLVLNIFIGFAMGANVIIARHLGARDGDGASRAVHTSLILAVALGTISGAIGLCISRPVLTLMGAEENLLDLALVYTRVYFLGTPFVALTNYAVAIFRSKGDTRTPLFVLSAAGLVNVGFNLLFVLVFGMSVEGVALATVVSNVLSAVVLLFVLSRDGGACRFSFKKLRLDKRSFLEILRIGLPAGIQGALFSLSNMIIQSSILRVNNILAPGSEYEPVVEGNAAVANLEGFLYTATNSVCQASVAFTSQNVGAGKYGRIGRVMLNCYAITTVVAVVGSLLLFGLNHPLLALYGISEGEGLGQIAYETAMAKIYLEGMTYFLLAFMEIGSGVLRGLGRSMTSTVIALVGSCLLRIVWIFTVFEHFLTVESIYISYPVSWALTGLVYLIFALMILRRESEKHRWLTGEVKQDTKDPVSTC